MEILLSEPKVLALVIQFALGGLASFVAILSWSWTRNLYWLFVIAGILSLYAKVLYQVLIFFGLVSGPVVLVFGLSLGDLLSDNLASVFFILACLAYIKTNR